MNQSKAQQIYSRQAADFVYEGTIVFRSDAAAALAFRSSTDGTRGYEATLVKEGEQVRVSLTKADGTAIAGSERPYPSLAGGEALCGSKGNG